MSPMIVRASDMRPPAPTPWKARNAASEYMLHAKLEPTEPRMKMLIAKRKIGRRPKMSESLPRIGVEIVEVMR